MNAPVAGYSLTRIRYPGRNVLATTKLIVYLVPPSLLFIPLYTILRGLGLANTLWAPRVAYPVPQPGDNLVLTGCDPGRVLR